MKSSILHFAKWICHCLTRPEFDSLLVIFLEVQGGSREDFAFKEEKPSPNYRDFRQDPVPPLREPPQSKPRLGLDDWKERLAAHQREHGRALRPVAARSMERRVPEHCRCEVCGAPHEYLYLNDGTKRTQYRCKVCSHLGMIEHHRHTSTTGFHCPHCGSSLYRWKENEHETIYKCGNDNCVFYLNNLRSLTSDEKAARKANRYDPNYKLRYQYREYRIDRTQLKCRRVENAGAGALDSIRNSMHTLGLVLSMFINLGLSSRQTRDALKGLFGVSISHQTVVNYVMRAAAAVSGWLDAHLPVPGETAAGDETYIQVNGAWHYTWFVIDAATRALCGYNLSDTRGRTPALQTLVNAYGEPQGKDGVQHTFVRDGLGSYDSALAAYNQMDEEAGRADGKSALMGKTVVGLENADETSREYRQYKQLIERLNRTYKFHTRPRNGFKDIDGATALTTLFVAYYNHLRPHSRLKRDVPVPLAELAGAELYPKQWEMLIELATA